MAKKKHHTRRRRSSASHSKKTHHRRRRMGAGGKAFKLLSDPIVGCLVGAAAGVILKNVVSGFVKDEKLKIIAAAIPVAGGFMLLKKMPFVAGGMAAGPILGFIAGVKGANGAPLIPMLSENGNTNFADSNLLLSGEGESMGEELVLSEQSYSLNEMEAGGYSDYQNIDEE